MNESTGVPRPLAEVLDRVPEHASLEYRQSLNRVIGVWEAHPDPPPDILRRLKVLRWIREEINRRN